MTAAEYLTGICRRDMEPDTVKHARMWIIIIFPGRIRQRILPAGRERPGIYEAQILERDAGSESGECSGAAGV